MLETIDLTTIGSIAAAFTAIGGAWLTLRRINRYSDKQKKDQRESVLKEAKEYDLQLRMKIDNKIHDLEIQLEVMRETHEKDLTHLRETYNGEIKFLGQKIESLREEVRLQHTQLVQLLSKMIERQT